MYRLSLFALLVPFWVNAQSPKLPDSVISESSVTQHQEALQINQSQIADLSHPPEVDGSVINELQSLSIVNNEVRISNGSSTANLTPYLPLTAAQVEAIIADDGYLLSEVDGSITNEIQDLDLSGDTLQLSGDPSAVDLSKYLDDTTLTDSEVAQAAQNEGFISGPHTIDTNTQLDEAAVDAFVANNGYSIGAHTIDTDTQLSEAQVDSFVANNGFLASEVDGSVSNELQTISLNGNDLSLSDGGGTVTLPGGNGSAHGDGANCAAGSYTRGVDENGNAQDCSLDQDTQLSNGQVASAAIAEGFVAGPHAVDTDTFVTNLDAHDHNGGDGAQIDHSTLSNLPVIPSGNQVIDWTASSAGTINPSNYVDNDTTYSIGDGGLTTNDFSNADHTKLDGIDSGATADQTQVDIEGLGFFAGPHTEDQTLSVSGSDLTISGGNTVTLPSSGSSSDDQTALEVAADTTNFNNNLSSSDTTVQAALDTIDNLSVAAGGVIEDWREVGDSGEPVFLNGWVNYGLGYATLAFKKINGVVHIKGIVKSGSTNTPIFQLPSGYRPNAIRGLAVDLPGEATELAVRPNGEVSAQGASNSSYAYVEVSFAL